MAKQMNCKRLLAGVALVLALVIGAALPAFAEAAPAESAKATGLYRHPETGKIEDSGGESSEALGQSMVNSVVDPQALVETAKDGSLYLSLRFQLMSNISEVLLSVQEPGDADWQTVSFESTDKQADSEDFRLPIPSKEAIVRAECMVDAMGRHVVFYVTVDDFTPGNAGGFAPMQADAKPAAQPAAGNVVGGDTVGLVTGGSAPAAKPAAPAVPEAAPAGTRTVMLSANVWIMFFVLVFCAQLLACLTFWGIQSLVRRKAKGHGSRAAAEPDTLASADEDDFDESFLDSAWTEDDDENP